METGSRRIHSVAGAVAAGCAGEDTRRDGDKILPAELITYREVAIPYSANNTKWATGACGFRIDPDWSGAWETTAIDAMDLWNQTGANFSFLQNPHSACELTSYDLGAWNGWIGMTYTQPTQSGSSLARCRILINAYYEFDPLHAVIPHSDNQGAFDLKTILAHELGHALHLGEDMAPWSQTMMRPVIKRGETRMLHQDDIDGIFYLYP